MKLFPTVPTVYVLTHPRTRRVRHVGSTVVRLPTRLSGYLSTANGDSPAANTPVHAWIARLLSQGLRPIITAVKLLPGATQEELEQAETDVILRFRSDGARLLNRREGGLGDFLRTEKMRQPRAGYRKGPIKSTLTGETWQTQWQAAEALGSHQRQVSEHLRQPDGRYPTIKGHVLVWVDDAPVASNDNGQPARKRTAK